MNDIKLRIPAKAENVLAIRLFVSGLAARCDFDIQKIEDIKTAISESCVLLLNGAQDGELLITVDSEEDLAIVLNLAGAIPGEKNPEYMPELSKMLLEGLADDAKITEVDGECIAVKLIFNKRKVHCRS